MTGFWADNEAKTAELDLHGYSTDQAMEIVEDKVKEAWKNGGRFLKVIHGAPEVANVAQAGSSERGYIKTKLLTMLDTGQWEQFVEDYDRENGVPRSFALGPIRIPGNLCGVTCPWVNMRRDEGGVIGGRLHRPTRPKWSIGMQRG